MLSSFGLGMAAGGLFGCGLGIGGGCRAVYQLCKENRSDNVMTNMGNIGMYSILCIPIATIPCAAIGAVVGMTYPLSIPLAIHLSKAEKKTETE